MKGMRKIKRGTGFRGALDYLDEEGKARIIGGNMSGQNARELASEFGIARALRPDIEKPVWHNSLRAPKGEIADEYRWRAIADEYMSRMGFTESHQYVIFFEDHPDGQHAHIVANRIGLDGSIYYGKNENLESTRIIHELEKKHGFEITPYRDELNPTTPKKDRLPSKNEIEKGHREGIQPPRMRIQNIVSEAMQDRPTTEIFLQRIEAAGVIARPNLASTGKMNGFSFELDGVAFKGSELGTQYTWKNIQRSIDYEQNRDIKVIADYAQRAFLGVDTGGDSIAGRSPRDALRGDSSAPRNRVSEDAEAHRISRSERESLGSSISESYRRGSGGDARIKDDSDTEIGRNAAQSATLAAAAGVDFDGGADKLRNDNIRASADGARDLHARSSNATGTTASAEPTAAASIKLEQWQRMHQVLEGERYKITYVNRLDKSKSGYYSERGNDVFTAAQVSQQLRTHERANMRGVDIYITPYGGPQHIIVDDLTRAGVEAMHSEGWRPALVMQTSRDNYQAVFLVEHSADMHDYDAMNMLACSLNKYAIERGWGGDPGVLHAQQPLRMPGFANKKYDGAAQFCNIEWGLSAPGTRCDMMHDAYRKHLEKARASAVAVERHDKQLVAEHADRMSREADAQTYTKLANGWRRIFEKNGRVDESSVDYRTCRELIEKHGFSEQRVRDAMLAGSQDIESRHGKPADYVERTVARAREGDVEQQRHPAADLIPKQQTPKPYSRTPKMGR